MKLTVYCMDCHDVMTAAAISNHPESDTVFHCPECGLILARLHK